MEEMEAVSKTILGWKNGGEKFQDGKLVQKPRMGKKILDQKIDMKNCFVQKTEKIVLGGESSVVEKILNRKIGLKSFKLKNQSKKIGSGQIILG